MTVMFEMPRYENPISLIPGGCPQILDYEGSFAGLDKIRYGFSEVPERGSDGKERVRLYAYRRNEDKEFVDETNPDIKNDNFQYEINAQKAIEPWLGEWLPVPFLRTREQNWPGTKDCRFEYGPTNWARARLTRSVENPDYLRLVLAFDMQVEDEQDIYAALRESDVDANAHFRLAWRFRDNSWFLDLPWVEEWLRGIWTNWKQARRIRDDGERQFEYLARYLAFLEALLIVSRECEVKVIRPEGPCVAVDLVLDIGNSRSTGMLVETQAQTATTLNNSYLLQLRDMEEPENIYTKPFETRVEFSEIQFGNDALSRRSGRKTPAFSWPSPVRIGPESGRLATQSRCDAGSTGMSSPKRYLWDERDWQRTWRFNTRTESSPHVTRGPLAQRVNSSGTPLCCMKDKRFTRNKNFKAQERESAFESLFTRSSLMMFLLVEIIQQALLTINSPGQRLRRDQRDRPRRLRQIIFTVPAGMPLAEQHIYKRWAIWAVRVLWEALGWEKYYVGKKQPGAHEGMDYRISPFVRCNWDEATCTQLVFIYNEVVHKFQGDARLFCELMGKPRDFDDKTQPSIRVATIDIGGGTTDLSITTFELASAQGSTPRLAAHPDFHDGFNLAGDDILRAVIAEHVLPTIGQEMKKHGVEDYRGALTALFGRETMNASVAVLNQRIQFVRQIAAPAGLCILSLYEKTDLARGNGRVAFTLRDCFAPAAETGSSGPFTTLFPMPGQNALDYINNNMPGGEPFNLLDTPMIMDAHQIDETIRDVLKDVLANLCEVISLYDCDALLITGRPSCWPAISDTVTSLLPVPPGRIYPMANYNIGGWYPFYDNYTGKMTDPKTTVVVGAILCSLAEGQMEGFSFDPRRLGLLPTARHIGEMELSGQIRKDKVWFDVDYEKDEVAPEKRIVDFNGPISVGFRQLDAERWTTTRFYILDYGTNQRLVANSLNLPLQVELKLDLHGLDDADDSQERDEGEFIIENIKDANGEDLAGNILEMRLQTLPREEGFWLDTGVVYEN